MKTTTGFAIVSLALCCTPTAYADTFGSDANIFDIEFVTIGNPGNADDTTGNPNPAGKVDYTYRIGTYEISEDMIDKANAEGGLGITIFTRGPDKPATQLSWFEAARFVNWLNTSSGFTPAYKFALQPGEIGYIANANNQLWTISDAGYDANNLYRNSLAKYVLTSSDEWYKAAYYDPNAGVYYDYPTGSNNVPDGIDFEGDPNFDANFRDGGNNQNPNDITDVGVFSPYGTAGQGGNVFEKLETDFDLVNGPEGPTLRGSRGGYFAADAPFMKSDQWGPGGADLKFHNWIGFRVASIPEPTACTLAIAALCLVVGRRF